jgi:hypothetical protein
VERLDASRDEVLRATRRARRRARHRGLHAPLRRAVPTTRPPEDHHVNRDDDLARLRRQLRAMAAVNEHLRVQLDALRAASSGTAADPPPSAPSPRLRSAGRRADIASDWTPTRTTPPGGPRDPVVVSRADLGLRGRGHGARRLSVTLLAPPSSRSTAPAGRSTTAFHQLTEGPPVEGAGGPERAAVRGRRWPPPGAARLRAPHGVDQALVGALPEGPHSRWLAPPCRRATVPTDWVAPLADGSAADGAHLAVTPDGTIVVVEAAGAGRSAPGC